MIISLLAPAGLDVPLRVGDSGHCGGCGPRSDGAVMRWRRVVSVMVEPPADLDGKPAGHNGSFSPRDDGVQASDHGVSPRSGPYPSS